MNFTEYIEALAVEYLGHAEGHCTFTNVDEIATKIPRKLFYPCVGMEIEGWNIEGTQGSEEVVINYNLYFVAHHKDTADIVERARIFRESFRNCMMFMGRIREDAKLGIEPAIRCSFAGSIGTKIEFAQAALYGYAVNVSLHVPMGLLLCWYEHIDDGSGSGSGE